MRFHLNRLHWLIDTRGNTFVFQHKGLNSKDNPYGDYIVMSIPNEDRHVTDFDDHASYQVELLPETMTLDHFKKNLPFNTR